LDALPLTLANKIDRRGLPSPEGLRPELEAGYLPPKTDLERKLVEIWQQTLGIEKVGVRDNFFDLGGHSLLLVQVQSQLREFLNREISIIDMFKYPTISSLINNLDHGPNEEPRFRSVHERAKRQKEAFARRKQFSERRMSRE
jgi:acyl carrier protein